MAAIDDFNTAVQAFSTGVADNLQISVVPSRLNLSAWQPHLPGEQQ